jgi:hypothetical protein
LVPARLPRGEFTVSVRNKNVTRSPKSRVYEFFDLLELKPGHVGLFFNNFVGSNPLAINLERFAGKFFLIPFVARFANGIVEPLFQIGNRGFGRSVIFEDRK